MSTVNGSLALLGLEGLSPQLKQELMKLNVDNPGLAGKVLSDQQAAGNGASKLPPKDLIPASQPHKAALDLLALPNLPTQVKEDVLGLGVANPGVVSKVSSRQAYVGSATDANSILKQAVEAHNNPTSAEIPMDSGAKKVLKAHPSIDLNAEFDSPIGKVKLKDLEVVVSDDRSGQTIYKVKGTNKFINIPKDKLVAKQDVKGRGVLNIAQDRGYPDPVSKAQEDYASKYTRLRDDAYQQGMDNDPLMQQLLKQRDYVAQFVGVDPQAKLDALQTEKDIAGRKASLYALAENHANSDPAVKAALEAHNTALGVARTTAREGVISPRQKADANYLVSNTDLPPEAITHLVSGANGTKSNLAVDELMNGTAPPPVNNLVGSDGVVVAGYYRKLAIDAGTPKEDAIQQTNIISNVRAMVLADYANGKLPSPTSTPQNFSALPVNSESSKLLPGIIAKHVKTNLVDRLIIRELHNAGVKNLTAYKGYLDGTGLDYEAKQAKAQDLLREAFKGVNIIDQKSGLTPDYLAKVQRDTLIKLGLYGAKGIFQ